MRFLIRLKDKKIYVECDVLVPDTNIKVGTTFRQIEELTSAVPFSFEVIEEGVVIEMDVTPKAKKEEPTKVKEVPPTKPKKLTRTALIQLFLKEVGAASLEDIWNYCKQHGEEHTRKKVGHTVANMTYKKSLFYKEINDERLYYIYKGMSSDELKRVMNRARQQNMELSEDQ
jgi:hypothetical protein